MAEQEQGTVEAVIATLNVVDADGDVLLPGAVAEGTPVVVSGFGHDVPLKGNIPVGVGQVFERAARLVVRASYFMDVPDAVAAFRSVKALGNAVQWSWGWSERTVQEAPMTTAWRVKGAKRLIASVVPREASPVLLGAGVGTGTLSAKELAELRAIEDAIVGRDAAARLRARPRTADQVVGEHITNAIRGRGWPRLVA